MRLLTLVGGFLIGSFWAMSAGQADVFGAKETVLDNGLRVVVVENNRAPVVTHTAWYFVGAMDEPLGKSGIAHFLEHLMFKGTDTRGPGEFSEIVARNGGRDNAFTAQDYTGYIQTVASDRLGLVMALEADRMQNLNIAEEFFEPERQVVLEERRQRTDTSPRAILAEQAASAFYRNHPYAVPIIGWEHEIEALTLQDAITFYQTWYAPNNAVVIVAGDVVAEDVFALAQETYGAVPARDVPARPIPQEPPLVTKTVVTYSDPRVRQPALGIRLQAPGLGAGADKQTVYALDVLSTILSGGTGLLYEDLVIEQKVAIAAGGWYDGDGRGPGQFGLFVSPADGVTLDEAEAALRASIARIVEEGVPQEEVARAITRLQDAAVTAMDSLSGPANVIGRSLMAGWTLQDIETWPETIGAVTVEQVNAAARSVFSGSGEVVTKLLSEETATQ